MSVKTFIFVMMRQYYFYLKSVLFMWFTSFKPKPWKTTRYYLLYYAYPILESFVLKYLGTSRVQANRTAVKLTDRYRRRATVKFQMTAVYISQVIIVFGQLINPLQLILKLFWIIIYSSIIDNLYVFVCIVITYT